MLPTVWKMCMWYSACGTLHAILYKRHSVSGTACCTLHAILCMPYSACHTLYAVFYMLYSACDTLCVILCVQFPACCTLHAVLYMQYCTCGTLCAILCMPYSACSTLRAVLCELYSTCDTLRALLCVQYSTWGTLCIVQLHFLCPQGFASSPLPERLEPSGFMLVIQLRPWFPKALKFCVTRIVNLIIHISESCVRSKITHSCLFSSSIFLVSFNM